MEERVESTLQLMSENKWLSNMELFDQMLNLGLLKLLKQALDDCEYTADNGLEEPVYIFNNQYLLIENDGEQLYYGGEQAGTLLMVAEIEKTYGCIDTFIRLYSLPIAMRKCGFISFSKKGKITHESLIKRLPNEGKAGAHGSYTLLSKLVVEED